MKLNKEEVRSLRNVVNYIYDIELKHYQETVIDTPEIDHIFLDLDRLAKRLDKKK